MKKRILLIALAVIISVCCVFLASCSCEQNPPDESSSSSSEQNGPGAQSNDKGVQNIKYLRVSNLGSDSITVKFNVYSKGLSYDIRYSEKEITEDNFDKATKADATVTGDAEITAVINGLKASLSKTYYIAVRPYVGSESNHGLLQTVRAGGNKMIPIDYKNSVTMVYHGESLHSFANLFDEQNDSALFFPATNIGTLYRDNDENQFEGKTGMTLSPIVNLEYKHYVSKVRVFYGETAYPVKVRWAFDEVDFQAPDSDWDGCISLDADELKTRAWTDIEVGANTRYVQLVFADGQAPHEFQIFGYQSGEGDPIATTLHKLPTMGEMMGMCGFVAIGGGNTPVSSVNCTTVLREYHNFGWSYNEKAYPGMSNIFLSQMGNFDSKYKEYNEAGILVVPCIQWANNIARKVDSNGLPVKENGAFVEAGYFEKFDPNVYFLYADNMFAFAGRYGSTSSTQLLNILRKHTASATSATGAGTIKWLEFGNEPNGEDSRGMVPYQLAALQSASYDGHEKTMVSSVSSTTGYHLGAINADPNMKVAMAGLAGTGGRYITSMCYWLKANRSDESIAMDAFNFHCYFSNTFYMNGTYIQTGVSPEYYNLVDVMGHIIDYRDKYYPEKEVWITEFGWDTNQSYETMTSAHAYGEYTNHQVQAMWLVRAYLLFSACGIDKATMYMCEDVSDDRYAVGKYGTCGVIGFEDGKEYKKDSYYYLYTLKNALGDYRFEREVITGNDHVWAYEFKTDEGKTAYAVWCPTMDGTKVANFELNIGSNSATLIQAVDEDIDGISSKLTGTDNVVKFDVSENPVYVIVD